MSVIGWKADIPQDMMSYAHDALNSCGCRIRFRSFPLRAFWTGQCPRRSTRDSRRDSGEARVQTSEEANGGRMASIARDF